MAEAIAFDIAGGLASKLSSLAFSQIGLWWNFKDDIEDLKNTISTIKAVLLDAEEQSMTSNLVKNWLEKLKDALYDADDLLDDFSTEALRKDLLSGNKLTKELKISNSTELECMEDHGPNGRQGDTESFFPSLKVLRLWNCPNMKSWWRTTKPIDDDSNEDDTTVIRASTMAFPCLSSLDIKYCPLTSMPLYPSLNEKLKLVNTSSRPLKQTIKMSITSTTPSTSTSSLPLSKLKSFHAENIEGLDTHMLDDCLQNMTSLERCFIDSCHLLLSLSGWQQHLIGLKTLIIKDCKEVDLEGMQWEPLKNLSCLVIDNIPKLVSLPIGIQHLVELKSLEIRNCSGLRSLFPVFQHLTSLEEFSIRNCNELELSAAGMQIFQDYTSLRALWLETIPKCQRLPEWLQHLTNLQLLYLVDLPNLTSLPDEMRCLTSLEELCIRQTPQLEERCRKDIGADWHKIAHIATVTIEDFQ
ncbi:hypothetical protein ERO13_D11G334601v2 [Gossypium hirsutum]|nr:hypothetical protein ERO13_D11G334601v2 [Gossypium hirsutum]KAG4123580.1 hypothetical protein ERO13_D11G334601v2 [Gossypium hirsutum]